MIPMAEINNHCKKKQIITTTTTVMQTHHHHQQGQYSSRRKPLSVVVKTESGNNTNSTYNRSDHQSRSRHLEEEEIKLAALAISFNIRLRSADMPSAMQERAIRHTRALLDAAAASRRPNPTLLACSLKKEFDSVYGPAWHCVAGKSFGSFVTHSPGGFLYFSVDSVSFLLFKTEVHVIAQPSPKPN